MSRTDRFGIGMPAFTSTPLVSTLLTVVGIRVQIKVETKPWKIAVSISLHFPHSPLLS